MRTCVSFIIMLPLLLGGSFGCVTGAPRDYLYERKPDGSETLHFRVAGTDSQVGDLQIETTGGLKLNLSGLATQDKIGQLQLQLLLAQTQATQEIIQSILPLFGGVVSGKAPTVISAGVAPTTGGPAPTSQPDAGLNSATRADLTARIDACPFMSSDEKATAKALLSKLP